MAVPRRDFGDGIPRRRAAAATSSRQVQRTRPRRDARRRYAASVDPAPLEASLRTEALPLDAGPTPFNLTAPPPLVQVPVAGESCGGGGGPVVLDVDETGSAIGDGSTGTHAYHPNAYCVWALRSETGCAAVDVDFLVSEPNVDELRIYASGGDLLARFSGRLGASSPTAPPRVAGCVGDGAGAGDLPSTWRRDGVALYVTWSTDAFHELGVGALEPVGFAATASSVETGGGACPPGSSRRARIDAAIRLDHRDSPRSPRFASITARPRRDSRVQRAVASFVSSSYAASRLGV